MENLGPQSLRSAKEKGNQAAAAAAKLERFAHTPEQTPIKNGQAPQLKTTGDRKSYGQASSNPAGVGQKNPTVNKGPGAGEKVQVPSLAMASATEAEPTLREIFHAINSCRASVEGLSCQIKEIKDELLLIKQELQKAVDRITGLEGRVSQVEDDVFPLQQDVKSMKEQLGRINEKMDEMENRLRRDNIRIVGLPERCEGQNPIAFLEGWFTEIFGRDAFSPQLAIERAHRVPFRAPPPGGRPRSLLMKFLNHRDKLTLMRKAREKGLILYNGARVSFFADFSPELQRRRESFVEIKRTLQKYDVKYALLYPARLRVEAMGEVLFFDSPGGVTHWYEENKQRLEPKGRSPEC